MPLKIVFLRPLNWSRLNPITKAFLPPSREYVSILRTSEIAFDLGIQIKYFYYVGQSCRLLKLMVKCTSTLHQNLCQNLLWEFNYNLRYIKSYVLNCF